MNQILRSVRIAPLREEPLSAVIDGNSGGHREFSAIADRHTLLLRFIAVNMAAFALVGAAWAEGWIHQIVIADSTGLTFAIVAVFTAGFIICSQRIWWLSKEIAALDGDKSNPKFLVAAYLGKTADRTDGSRQLTASAQRLRIAGAIAIVRQFAASLVLLGLIGTVLGFIIALSGVDADAVSDVKAISPMVSQLLAGMAVALYTTLVGAALNLWLMVNYHMLSSAATTLLTRLIDLAEADACSK